MTEDDSAAQVASPDMSWQDPAGPLRYRWDAIARELREHPMTWARVFEQDRTSLVVAVRQGAIVAVHPRRGYETQTRRNVREPGEPRRCDLYMRFNPNLVSIPGQPSPQPPPIRDREGAISAFYAKTERHEDTGCLWWTGTFTHTSPLVWDSQERRMVSAARWIYEQTNGPIPPWPVGSVRRRCGVAACVEITHLEERRKAE